MNAGNGRASLITGDAIRAWLEHADKDLPVVCVPKALDWANEAWFRSDLSAAIVEGSVELDRLYALVKVVYEDPDGAPSRAEEVFRALKELEWPSGAFDEKLDLLSRMAYVASRQYRRSGEPRSSWIWEKTAVGLTRQLPAVSEFLALEEQQRSEQVRDRFLADPCVLMTLCAGLYPLANSDPAESLRQALSAYSYAHQSELPDLQADERRWFLLQLEIIIAMSNKFSGNYVASDRWLDLAADTAHSVAGSDISMARIEFARRSLDYDRRNFGNARAGLANLADRFRGFGMERYAALTTYLDGVALKEMGRHSEALPQLYSVAITESSELEEWVRGLALLYVAEISALNGDSVKAFKTLSEARTLMGSSRPPLAVGHSHAVEGQILRDLGHLDSAVESYRLASDTYAASGHRSLETLLRIILAETLLGCGRDGEALSEIIKALPIIETLGLVQEGVVALALLRESLSRQSADKEALMELRRALQRHNEGNRS